MPHRRALLCTLTLAIRHAGFAAAVFLRASQAKRVVANTATRMYRLNVGRSNIRNLTRAAFAASGTAHLSQHQHHGLESSRPSRWVSSSSSRGSNMGAGWWCSRQQPVALSMSAAPPPPGSSSSSSSSARSLASGPLRFRGGATSDGKSCRYDRCLCLCWEYGGTSYCYRDTYMWFSTHLVKSVCTCMYYTIRLHT